MTKEKIEILEKCSDCKGTGLYVGFAEKDGAAVVCHTCKGTGCCHYVHEYEEFKSRSLRPGVLHVIEANPGIGVGKGTEANYSLSDFGGMPYKDWLEGQPFLRGMEMRKFTCPVWWYQATDYSKKPSWEECRLSGTFSGCKRFKTKDQCWTRFDRENP